MERTATIIVFEEDEFNSCENYILLTSKIKKIADIFTYHLYKLSI